MAVTINEKAMFFLFIICFFPCLASASDALKIAIVGAGIGGASMSHYLLKNLSNIAEIKIFEKEAEAGGRTNHFTISEELKIEMGASFFIEANKNLLELAQIYNCSYTSGSDLKEVLGFWNEKSFVFQSSTRNYITMLKMLWRYGVSPLYFFKENSKMVENFLKIYDNVTYHNYSEFLSLVKAERFVNITMEEYLTKEDYNKDFINEFVGGVISGIYNQKSKNINSFAGMIALAGANNKAYHFQDGNRECVKKIIKSQEKVNLQIDSTVKKIYGKADSYSITYQDKSGKLQIEDKFDIVVLAAPHQNIEIETNNTSMKQKRSRYVEAFVYLIAGQIKCNYFQADENECPGILMNINLNQSIIADYSRKCKECYELKNKSDVYKIQATKELNKSEISAIFNDGIFKILDSKNWEAYPFLRPLNETDFYDIQIEDGIYYLNGMELLASCMEMETISAKNIAKLIWEHQLNKKQREENNEFPAAHTDHPETIKVEELKKNESGNKVPASEL
jgi:prenylcysteine oxidase/farnesylcysteine lyase